LAGRSTADIALKDAESKIKFLGVAHRERPAIAHRLGGPSLVSWVVVVGGAVGDDQHAGVANSQRLCIHGACPSLRCSCSCGLVAVATTRAESCRTMITRAVLMLDNGLGSASRTASALAKACLRTFRGSR